MVEQADDGWQAVGLSTAEAQTQQHAHDHADGPTCLYAAWLDFQSWGRSAWMGGQALASCEVHQLLVLACSHTDSGMQGASSQLGSPWTVDSIHCDPYMCCLRAQTWRWGRSIGMERNGHSNHINGSRVASPLRKRNIKPYLLKIKLRRCRPRPATLPSPVRIVARIRD